MISTSEKDPNDFKYVPYETWEDMAPYSLNFFLFREFIENLKIREYIIHHSREREELSFIAKTDSNVTIFTIPLMPSEFMKIGPFIAAFSYQQIVSIDIDSERVAVNLVREYGGGLIFNISDTSCLSFFCRLNQPPVAEARTYHPNVIAIHLSKIFSEMEKKAHEKE